MGEQVAETVGGLIEGQRNQFNSVVSVKGITFEREAQFAMQILQDPDSYIHKVAMANKSSLVAAINNVAAIGISLNPASKLAYLVPRKGAICYRLEFFPYFCFISRVNNLRDTAKTLSYTFLKFIHQGH